MRPEPLKTHSCRESREKESKREMSLIDAPGNRKFLNQRGPIASELAANFFSPMGVFLSSVVVEICCLLFLSSLRLEHVDALSFRVYR